MANYLEMVKKGAVLMVIVMIVAMIVLLICSTLYSTIMLFLDEDPLIIGKADALHFFGSLLLIVIGLELLDTVYFYITESKIQVETVLLVAMTAVARELIVFDYEHMSGLLLAGIGGAIAAVATSYFLLRKVSSPKSANA
mgnify:CR=1 FL=1